MNIAVPVNRRAELQEFVAARNSGATAAKVEVVQDRINKLKLDVAEQSRISGSIELEMEQLTKTERTSLASSMKRLRSKFGRSKPQVDPRVDMISTAHQQADTSNDVVIKVKIEQNRTKTRMHDLTQRRAEAMVERKLTVEQLIAADSEKRLLELAMEKEDSAFAELNALDESAAAGPTSELPVEGDPEIKVNMCQEMADQTLRRAVLIESAHGSMVEAVQNMTDCNQNLAMALEVLETKRKLTKISKGKAKKLESQFLDLLSKHRQGMEIAKDHYGHAYNLVADRDILPPDPFVGQPEGDKVRAAFYQSLQNLESKGAAELDRFHALDGLARFTLKRFEDLSLKLKTLLSELQAAEITALQNLENARKMIPA